MVFDKAEQAEFMEDLKDSRERLEQRVKDWEKKLSDLSAGDEKDAAEAEISRLQAKLTRVKESIARAEERLSRDR